MHMYSCHSPAYNFLVVPLPSNHGVYGPPWSEPCSSLWLHHSTPLGHLKYPGSLEIPRLTMLDSRILNILFFQLRVARPFSPSIIIPSPIPHSPPLPRQNPKPGLGVCSQRNLGLAYWLSVYMFVFPTSLCVLVHFVCPILCQCLEQSRPMYA